MRAVDVSRMLFSMVVRVLWQWGGRSASDEEGSGWKIRAALAVLVVGFLSAAAVAESGGLNDDALAVVDEHCRANSGEAEQCACEREAFQETVLSRASSPAVGLFAAHIHTGDEMAMMQAVQSLDSGALQEVGFSVGLKTRPTTDVHDSFIAWCLETRRLWKATATTRSPDCGAPFAL